MSRRRAFVLVGVHVVMAAHIIQWLIQGMTVSPIEPSEAMYTLELGQLNAGFVIFCLALLSTLLFGRFFCGWACHVVALQDLCGHWMQKLGVRPRPFRSRLPLFWGLLLALYMFVWPTFKRVVVFPIMEASKVPRPAWLADVAQFPGLHPEFIVEDFWKTFAPWHIAIPFLLVCGFATVYFLGNKAFCTYACPYGGFFAPLDRLSIGKITVSDACNHCGHCTSVCTSNVRVHQEVRDFGQVMDPGCMKCLDCVSVCPNDALSFSFGKPSILRSARTPEARAGKIDRPRSDLSWPEEVWVFAAGIAIFLAVRQFMNVVPLLMAAGIAMIGAFSLWKLSRLFLDDSIRLQSLQLKTKGRVTPHGFVFAGATVLFALAVAWSGYVRWLRYSADQLDHRITTPYEVVYSPGYSPSAEDRERATRALGLHLRAGSPRQGGVGWSPNPEQAVRMAWLAGVAGDLDASESHLRTALELAMPGDDLVFSFARIRALKGDTPQQINDALRPLLTRYPNLHAVRLAIAQTEAQAGSPDAALTTIEPMLTATRRRPTPLQIVIAAELVAALGKPERALAALRDQRERTPDQGVVRAGLARTLFLTGAQDDALPEMRMATELEPTNVMYWQMLSEMYSAMGRQADAQSAAARASDLLRSQTPQDNIGQPPNR